MKNDMMKAVITTAYGAPEVLAMKVMPIPKPKKDEVLIKIHATAVTAAQMAMRAGKPYIGRLMLGLTKPKKAISGTDLAGVVEAVGSSVTRFQVGDEIFGSTDLAGGSYAEYTTVSEQGVIMKKPDNIDFSEATALIEGALTALPFLRDYGKISKGKKVLINGASGSIGTAAIQLARFFGAEVTAVTSTSNLEWVKALGADHVIDYKKEDFTKKDLKYDLIFDTVGRMKFATSKNILNTNGRYLSPVLDLKLMLEMLATSWSGKIRVGKGKRAIFSATGLLKNEQKLKNLALIRTLIENNQLKAVIDRRFDLEQIIEAHRYVEKGHKKGNVVVEMQNQVVDKNTAPALIMKKMAPLK